MYTRREVSVIPEKRGEYTAGSLNQNEGQHILYHRTFVPSITKAEECAMKNGNRHICAYDRVEMKPVNIINKAKESDGQLVDDQLRRRKRPKR